MIHRAAIYVLWLREMKRFVRAKSRIIGALAFPLFFLSGALYPLENFPVWLRVLSSIDPLTYGIDGLRGIMIGQSSYPVVFNLGIMVAFSLIMIFLGAYFFEKSESV